VAVGSARFLVQSCGENALCSQEHPLRAQGKTLVHVAVDGRPAGMVALRDELRLEAGEVIAALRRRGVRRVLLLTGDHQDAAEAVLAGLDGPAAPDEVRAG
jgi:P-type E1-E2 ATPase